ICTGELLLNNLPEEDRTRLKMADDKMALRVKHVGQYGPHAAAKKAGFQVGDILVEFDGRSDFEREADLHYHAMTARKPGDRVEVVVLRKGQRKTLQIPMQE
ncbi:MAG: PDZ domain-containing protein, partial [Planctomycetaceae bacterium]|nr:PDZ domain-containing protein [Planctomycetaceae bacterium]